MMIEERIEQASAALIRGEDANWELARLTWESTIADGGRPTYERISMKDWCTRIREHSGREFGELTGRYYRAVWDKYCATRHDSNESPPSWTEAYFAVRGTTSQHSFANVNAKQAIKNLEHVAPEVKRELAEQLANDPDVAERLEHHFIQKAGRDPGLAAKVDRAYEEFHPAPEPRKRLPSAFDQIGFGSAIYAGVWTEQAAVQAFAKTLQENPRPLPEQLRAIAESQLDSLEKTRRLIIDYEDLLRAAMGIDVDATFRRLVGESERLR